MKKKTRIKYNQGGDLGATLGSQIGGYALGAAGQAIGIPMPVGKAVGTALGGVAGNWIGDQFGQETPIKPPDQSVIPQKDMLNNSGSTNPYGSSIVYAMGGPLNRPQITEYVGPRHENGGVPLGNTNTEVEGGEVRVGDFVFTDRLNIPDGDVSFAKAAKAIQKKYSDRKNDKIDNDTMMRELAQLAKVQESVKVERSMQENSINKQGGSPEIKARGGLLNNKNTKKLYYGGNYDRDPTDLISGEGTDNPPINNNRGELDIDNPIPMYNKDGIQIGRKYNIIPPGNHEDLGSSTVNRDKDPNDPIYEEGEDNPPVDTKTNNNESSKVHPPYLRPHPVPSPKVDTETNNKKTSNDASGQGTDDSFEDEKIDNSDNLSSENKFKDWLKKLEIDWDKLSLKDKQKLKDKYNSGNTSTSTSINDLTKTGLSTLGGIYDVARGLSGGNYESYGRLSPIRLNQINPSRAVQQQREIGRASMSSIRNIGGQGLGQYLNNVGGVAANTQKGVANIQSQYDQANAGILNRQKQLNNQIAAQNLQMDMKQNDINARERDAASSDIQKGLTTISQGLNQQFQDQAYRNVQDQMLRNWIGTNDLRPIQTQDGQLIMGLRTNVNGQDYYISGTDNDSVYDVNGNYLGKKSEGFFENGNSKKKNNNENNQNNTNNKKDNNKDKKNKNKKKKKNNTANNNSENNNQDDEHIREVDASYWTS